MNMHGNNMTCVRQHCISNIPCFLFLGQDMNLSKDNTVEWKKKKEQNQSSRWPFPSPSNQLHKATAPCLDKFQDGNCLKMVNNVCTKALERFSPFKFVALPTASPIVVNGTIRSKIPRVAQQTFKRVPNSYPMEEWNSRSFHQSAKIHRCRNCQTIVQCQCLLHIVFCACNQP